MPVETSASICAWGNKSFGEVEDLAALVARAKSEMVELEEAVVSQESLEAIADEAADVAILLHRLLGILGQDLADAVDRKMSVNRGRQWIPSGDGTGNHVEE